MTALIVNGEPMQQGGGITLERLIESLGRSRRGIAVALNGEVVPRSSWAQTVLHDGDRVEVVAAIAGG